MMKYLTMVCCILAACSVHAVPKAFDAANAALAEGRFDEAVNLYHEAAAEAPESGGVYFNLGNALYRTGRYSEAAAAFEYAASAAASEYTRGRSWYNIGNCMVMSGRELQETDPQGAAEQCRQAAWFYRMALDYDPGFEDAAYNLELSQRMLARIQEEISRQQEEEEQQNELMEQLREKLKEFAARQAALLEAGDTGDNQQQLEAETRALQQLMERSGLQEDVPMPDGTTMPGPLKETLEHTANAAEAMAVPNQQAALEQLQAALDSIPEDPNQGDSDSGEESDEFDDYDMEYEESDEDAALYDDADPFGDFSEYEEIRGVPPPNQTEMDILAEEVQNQERRKQKKAGEYKAVEKDW